MRSWHWSQTLREDREAVILADALGFHDAFLGEHLTDACENVTNSMLFQATLIHETKTIKLATGTTNLSQMHPVLIAVNAAMLDHLAQGRFILGVSAGALPSDAEAIGLLDADLQNAPADFPMMREKIDQGYEVVSGWRINRQDTFVTRTLPSRIANWLISTVTGVHLHDYGCTLKAYRRAVLTGFRLYGEMQRFIPAYAYSVGARMI